MAAITIESHGPKPWPRNTRLRLVALPNGNCLFDGEITKSLTRDLDPGKYELVAKFGNKMTGRFREQYSFLHDCTEEEWKVMTFLEPKMSSLLQSTQGPLWTCRYFNCGETRTSRFAAVVHEAEHFGMTLQQIISDALARDQVGEFAEEQMKKQTIAAQQKLEHGEVPSPATLPKRVRRPVDDVPPEGVI